MSSDTKEKRQPVPYISFKTFISFVESIHGKVPIQIDASILRHLSGTARSQLLSALKFLGLVNTDGIVEDSLKRLADAYNGPEWKTALSAVIMGAYGPVLAELDLKGATPGLLRDRFRTNGGVDGGTVDSALRFFVSALQQAGIEFSPHLIVRQRAPRGSGVARKRTGATTGARSADDTGYDDANAEAQEKEGMFKIPLAAVALEGTIILPDGISGHQWETINEFVKTVIALRQRTQVSAEE